MGFTRQAQDVMAELFLEALSEMGDSDSERTLNKQLSELLKEKEALISRGGEAPAKKEQEVDLFVAKRIPKNLYLKFAECDAKLIDTQWRARKVSGILMLKLLTERGGVRNGDRFDEVLERFRAASVPPAELQAIMHDAVVWPSLTTHPTNPTSLAFTQAGLGLDKLLADPNSEADQIKAALKGLINTSMDETLNPETGRRRKTPEMEAEELIDILSVVYHSVCEPRLALRAALDKYGYESVKTQPLVDLHVWGPGDGDGNPNMGAEALETFLRQLRNRLTTLYLADIHQLREQCHRHPAASELDAAHAEVKQAIDTVLPHLDTVENCFKEVVQSKDARTQAAKIAQLQNCFGPLKLAVAKIPASAALGSSSNGKDEPGGRSVLCTFRVLFELCDKFETFGLHFAKVDVRHNSRDIMATVGRLLQMCDALPESDFASMSPQRQADILRSRLQDASLARRVSKCVKDNGGSLVLEKKFGGKGDPMGKLATRLFRRMVVVGAHPGRFQKFIIAETTSVANVLGALLLLKCGGAQVMVPGSELDVVPLFESREDLRNAPQTVHELLTDPSFSANCQARGYLLAMIAKSDTARLSGAGVQGAQEETMGMLLSMHPNNYHGVRVCVMLGGGDDQMRGGGRIVESPHVVMRAQAREGGSTVSRIAMTLQGMQLQLILGSPVMATHFFQAFAAQMLLANGRIAGLVQWRPPNPGINDTVAAKQTHQFFKDCMDGYERAIGSEKEGDPIRRTVVDYLNGYPAAIIEWTNKSSRPGARKKTNDPLRGRAISLDQLSKHDGAYITATLGVAEALERLSKQLQCGDSPGSQKENTGSPAHWHAYGNKAFRDFIRLQATVLFQKDYCMAWNIRGGAPGYLEREQLEAAYVEGGYNPPRVFLAHQEKLDHKEAYLIAGVITQRFLPGPVALKDPLRFGWPQLCGQLEYRESLSRFAKRFELKSVRRIHRVYADARASRGTEVTFSETLKSMSFYAYVGVNPSWSSPNFSLTMTDRTKGDGHRLLSESNPAIQAYLPKLKWMEARRVTRSDAAAIASSKL